MGLENEQTMETTEVKFHEITLSDKEWVDARLAEDDRNACEYTFANNFIWRNAYQVEVAEVCGCLVIRFQEDGAYCYSYPVGVGDKKAAIEQLLLECKNAGRKLHMSPLSDADRRQMLAWFPGQFLITAERADFDYIYSREKLATLAGKKLHGKRNHIARFKDGDDWSYEPMTAENLEECRQMTYTWIKMRSDKWNEEMEQEIMVLHEAFDHKEELGLIGGVLRKAGEIVAFTMGERLNSNTFVVHFEKAYPDMQGAYPMINQQFVQHVCGEYEYVNREEDTGDLGLRKAKMSYYPEILLKKYVAVESDVVYADRDTDETAIRDIWKQSFGDADDYISFYLDHRMTEENMLIIKQDGKAVSMASFLPVQYLHEGSYIDACYVYAVATLPEYRGQGYARKIMEYARALYEQPLLLAPAEESLITYYEKIGFQSAFPRTRQQLTSGVQALEIQEESAFCMEEVTAAEYAKIRDNKCAREGYVRWDEQAVQYAMELCANGGGKTVVVMREEDINRDEQLEETDKDVLMYETDGDMLYILETSLTKEALKELLPELFAETGTSEVQYGQMGGMIWLPETMQMQQICTDGYLALTLD